MPLTLLEQARHAELEVLLTDVTIRLDQVQEYAYLEAHRSGKLEQGYALPPLQSWIQTDDLVVFWQCVDWWPQGYKRFPCPTLMYLCTLAPWMPGQPDSYRPFRQALMEQFVNPVTVQLQADNRNVVNPNESKEARKARLNREAQSRFREARRTPHAQLDDATVALIADMQVELDAALKQRTLELAAAQRETLHKQAEFFAASRHGKALKGEWLTRIDAIKERMRQARAT